MKNNFTYCKKSINISVLIFGTAFIIYVFLGLCISYQMVDSNIFFGADNARAFEDLTCIKGNHYRTKVHPLFPLLAETITLFINGAVNRSTMSVIIIEAFCGAVVVSLFYSILKRKKIEKLIRIIFTFIYGFSFSMMIFSTVPETFIFAALGLICFWYFIALISSCNHQFSKKELFLLIFFGITCFGVTLTNYIFYMIGLVYLLLCRYDKKDAVKAFFLINVVNAVIIVILCKFQQFIWNECPLFWTSIIDGICGRGYEETRYMNWTFTFSKTVAWVKQIAFTPLLSSDMYLQTPEEVYHPIIFSGYSSPVKLILLFFYILVVGCVFFNLIKLVKKFNLMKDGYMVALFVSYIGNLALHYIYGYSECFMYSPHYLFYILLFVAISVDRVENQKIKKIIICGLLYFCAVEVVNNLKRFFQAAHLALSTVNSSVILIHAIKGTILCGSFLLIIAVWWVYRNLKEEMPFPLGENVEKCIQRLCGGIKIYSVVVLITGLFIAFNF